MPRLADYKEGLERLASGTEPAEPTPDQVEVVNLQTVCDAIGEREYPDIAPALVALQHSLSDAADRREQALEKSVKALIRVLDKFKVDVAAPEVSLEATISTEEIAQAIRELMPEQKPVKFEIERNRSGYIQSVIATPIGESNG